MNETDRCKNVLQENVAVNIAKDSKCRQIIATVWRRRRRRLLNQRCAILTRGMMWRHGRCLLLVLPWQRPGAGSGCSGCVEQWLTAPQSGSCCCCWRRQWWRWCDWQCWAVSETQLSTCKLCSAKTSIDVIFYIYVENV